MNSEGYLKIILGCMFSGKTSELFKEYKRHEACGYECLLINHRSDTRYVESDKETSTHDGRIIHSINVGNNLFDFFKKPSYISRYDVIFINEGQFFNDLYDFVNYLVNIHNKKVYVCGLDGDFQRKKFGKLFDIIPLCNDLIKLKAICGECKIREGIFTHRINENLDQTFIGGADSYKPLCRTCYNNLNN